ncbi:MULTISPECIES: peptidoglycan editing factor PgeF [Ornithinibacillus]|nr:MULTISPECIES: peptidoglycan editing factor PgeF [Ornithinibacillus]
MQDIFQYDGNSLLHINKWMEMEPNLTVGFTTRHGGVSKQPFHTNNMGLHVFDDVEDVLVNRKRLATTLHIPLDNWVSGEQVHHSEVHIVDSQDAGRGAITVESSLIGIDGLISNQKGILCTAFFADCVPLFFFDPVTKYVGIAHAGWKGTVARIAEKTILKFIQLGSAPKDIRVAIGPSISTENYEVDNYVKNRIPQEFHDVVLIETGHDHYLLDLKQLNVEILVQAGVFRSNIDVTSYCTYRDENLFFSHRRDQGKTGRMLGYIGFTG